MIDLRWLPNHFFRNLVSLHGAQATVYLLPLITIPYIVRVIGPEKYGLIALAAAAVQYFVIVSEYGYNFTGPREVARTRDDKMALEKYVNSMLWTRIFLASLSFVMGGVALIFMPLIPELKILVIFGSGVLVGKVLFPLPVLCGLERAKSIATYTIAGGLLSVVLIFTMIQTPGDYLRIPLIYSTVSVIIGCTSLMWTLRRMDIRVRKPQIGDVKNELRSGFRLFLSTGMISFYVVGNTLVLGMFAPSAVVGWYAAGEKLVRMAQGLFIPFQTLLFPGFAREAVDNKTHALVRLRKAAGVVAPVGLAVSLVLIILAEPIAHIVFGLQFSGTADVLTLLGAVPLIMSMTLLFSDTFLIGFGYEKYWSTMIIWAGILSIVMSICFVAILEMRHIGSSLALLMTELFVLFGALLKFQMEPKLKIEIAHQQQ